jgi:hypothetical protein
MKNPSSRYLAGYVFRALLGTAIVLCAISAARILLLNPGTLKDAPPWDMALQLPDRLVHQIVDKLDTRNAPAPTTPTQVPYAPQPQHAQPTASIEQLPPVASHPEMPSMPSMPSMPDTHVTDPSSVAPSTDDTVEWGTTIASAASIYDATGKRLGQVPAGTLLEVKQHKESSAGDLLVCTLIVGGKRRPQAVIVRNRDVIVNRGNLAAASERERALRVQYARILAGIATRKQQLKDGAAGSNPQKQQYVDAAREYKQFAERANRLREEYNTSSGPRRMEVADELRRLKHDEVKIVSAYKAAKQQHEEWKQNHKTTAPATDQDPTIQRLRQQKAATEDELAKL